MEDQVVEIINEIGLDLQEACAASGESLCAVSLAEAVGDLMHDRNPEYRKMPYEERRDFVLQICRRFV